MVVSNQFNYESMRPCCQTSTELKFIKSKYNSRNLIILYGAHNNYPRCSWEWIIKFKFQLIPYETGSIYVQGSVGSLAFVSSQFSRSSQKHTRYGKQQQNLA